MAETVRRETGVCRWDEIVCEGVRRMVAASLEAEEDFSRVRDEMGLTNVVVMIPFCRTTDEADRVLAVMAEEGLPRGGNGLKVKVYVMAQIPSSVILAAEFAERFDGFSIGSNDLTQLTLGVDRDSDLLAHPSTRPILPSPGASRA